MKKIIVLLGFSFFAFAGTASAAGCHYDLAKSQDAVPLAKSENPTDPKLLALLKKKEAESQAQDAAQPIFN